jgi:hypothetical protein
MVYISNNKRRFLYSIACLQDKKIDDKERKIAKILPLFCLYSCPA